MGVDARGLTGGYFHTLRIFPRDVLVKTEGVERTDEAARTEEPSWTQQSVWIEEAAETEEEHSHDESSGNTRGSFSYSPFSAPMPEFQRTALSCHRFFVTP